ncbi:MAG: hypothetical protein K2I89_08065 [Muribaculaceae bacterium]|nr:hypothetical protein [Muribaculaceae bacterium]
MNKKSYLLPYSCQRYGWFCLAVALIATITFLCVIESKIASSNILQIVIICFATIGLLLLCFSKEKNEDEYIGHLRTRILTWIVAYALIASALKTVLSLTLVWVATLAARGIIAYITSFFFTNPLLLGIIYLLVFKSSLLIANRKCE